MHLKVVGREDKITLLPTWVDVSVEDVEVRWDYCVTASVTQPLRAEVRTWVAARRGDRYFAPVNSVEHLTLWGLAGGRRNCVDERGQG